MGDERSINTKSIVTYRITNLSGRSVGQLVNNQNLHTENNNVGTNPVPQQIRPMAKGFQLRDNGEHVFDSFDDIINKMYFRSSVEPVLLIKNDFCDYLDKDNEEIIIPDTSTEELRHFKHEDNKTDDKKSREEMLNYSSSDKEHYKEDEEDVGDIILLCSSDEEEDKEGETKIEAVEKLDSSVPGHQELDSLKKDEMDIDDVICISDDDDEDSKEQDTVKKVSGTKIESPVPVPTTLVQPEMQSASSSRSQSPVRSVSDCIDNEGDSSSEQIIFLLNEQFSTEDEEEEEDELNDLKSSDDLDFEGFPAENKDEIKDEVLDHSEVHPPKQPSPVRRTSRRTVATKARCPCCINSNPANDSTKEEHAKVKKPKDKPQFKVSKVVKPAAKKIKLDLDLKTSKCVKKEFNGMKRLVTDLVAKTDKVTNAEYINCPTCNYVGKNNDELTIHWRTKHSVSVKSMEEVFPLLKACKKNDKCTVCMKMSAESENINKHVSWHTKSNKAMEDCVLCSMLYNKLKYHVGNHAPYGCRLCTKSFTNDIDLKNHLIVHLYEINSDNECGKRCKLCAKQFTSIYDNILEHLIMHHSYYNFLTTDDMIKHKVKSTSASISDYLTKRLVSQPISGSSEVTYICLYCTMSYHSISGFLRHLQNNHISSQRECGICKMPFKTYKELRKHIKSKHTDINEKFNCPVCKRSYTNVTMFQSHFKVHGEQDLKNYNCPICSNVLSNMYSLKRHLLVHTGERPHLCEKCDSRFRDRRNLVTHMQTVHTLSSKLLCSVCEKWFTCKDYLVRHMRKCHCKVL